ncbi:MAG: YdcF family protein [Rhizonema sp. NSF051]|nr:YdcF family protein [Rhizonema sp. NSF051]
MLLRFHHVFKKLSILTLVGFLAILLISIIPVRLFIASYQAPQPQAIFTLGGGQDREEFTAQFASAYSSLDIWVSSGTPDNKAREIFRAAGIPDRLVHLDYRAVDTVTNFTSLVEDFKSQNIQHLYLITSDFHMPRAKAIATLVLGSRGIAFTPISIPSNQSKESLLHILRDSGRSILWIVTGRTGASFNLHVARLSYAFR